jgi:hypothetical protein
MLRASEVAASVLAQSTRIDPRALSNWHGVALSDVTAAPWSPGKSHGKRRHPGARCSRVSHGRHPRRVAAQSGGDRRNAAGMPCDATHSARHCESPVPAAHRRHPRLRIVRWIRSSTPQDASRLCYGSITGFFVPTATDLPLLASIAPPLGWRPPIVKVFRQPSRPLVFADDGGEER